MAPAPPHTACAAAGGAARPRVQVEPSFEAKLRFLQSARAFPGLAQPPQTLQTHMSWVFFAGDRVYKLKKPVRFPFLDFTTLQARAFYCREEVRLNERLAPGVYLGLVALQAGAGGLALVPEPELRAGRQTVDWLVLMRRLPQQCMLQHMIAERRVDASGVEALVRVLAAFYQDAARVDVAPREYLLRLQREQSVNREVLLRPQFALRQAAPALDRMDLALVQCAALVRERARQHRIVDGHGDLRPEHVCMLAPPVVIDCLEFNPQLRQVDPWSEIGFLALECDIAGAPWIGAALLGGCAAAWREEPAHALMSLYTARHALLRARLAMAHLLDPHPRTPDRWPPLAQRYVERALRELRCLPAAAQASEALRRRS